MKVRITLYGGLRAVDAAGHVDLELPEGSDVAALRRALVAHLQAHAGGRGVSLVRRSAFASSEEVLQDADTVPAGGELAVLPPVSGG